MDTRKITLIATIAAIALVAVGIGYAYSATTVTTTNTLTETSVEIIPYSAAIGDVTVGTTVADYEGTAKNVTYNTYNNGGTKTYNIDGVHSLTEIQTIAIKWTDPGDDSSVELATFTMAVSNTSIDTYLTTNASCIVAKLTKDTKTWTGTYNTTDDCWVFNMSSDGDNTAKLTASKTGEKYSLTFATANEGDTPEGNPLAFKHQAVLDSTAFTITFKGTVSPA